MTQDDPSKLTEVNAVTIRAFERCCEMRDSNRNLLGMAFEWAGLMLLPENGGGADFSFRDPAASTTADDGSI
ncbi:hypothetical protein FHR71_002269 [Methylobacterium sp. RAS18]|nr:hypothetical protein [Methylobacterium sp. RAS18]